MGDKDRKLPWRRRAPIVLTVTLIASIGRAGGPATLQTGQDPYAICLRGLPDHNGAPARAHIEFANERTHILPISAADSAYEPRADRLPALTIEQLDPWGPDERGLGYEPRYAVEGGPLWCVPPPSDTWPVAGQTPVGTPNRAFAYDAIGETSDLSSSQPVISPPGAILLACLSAALVGWSRRRRAM